VPQLQQGYVPDSEKSLDAGDTGFKVVCMSPMCATLLLRIWEPDSSKERERACEDLQQLTKTPTAYSLLGMFLPMAY